MKQGLVGRFEFIEGVRTKFPESLKEMDDLDDELLHIDMANFARSTEQAIISRDKNLVQGHFNFISDLFSNAHPDLKNAIYVSYLENVLLGQPHEKHQSARALLPANLEQALKDLEKHFEEIYK